MEGTEAIKKKRWTSSLKEFIAHNKIITLAATIFTLCFALNIALIWNFMMLLENR